MNVAGAYFIQERTAPANRFEPSDVCKVLPRDAREILRRAAAQARSTTQPLLRQRVIEDAVARVKLQYPRYFKQESYQ